MSRVIALMICMSCLSVLRAQDGSGVDVNISANVIDQIEVITIADIDAGEIIPGPGEKVISPITDSGAGVLRIEGQRNSTVQVLYSKVVTMTNINATQPLIMNYQLSGGQESNQAESNIFQSNPATITLNEEGVYNIWVGCRFKLEGLVSGQYDGDFIIEVEYN